MTTVSGTPAGARAAPGTGGVTPARLIMAVFFFHALLLGNWVPRVPDIAAALGLDHRALAIALLGMPVGTFIAIALSGRIVERLTPRLTILALFPIYCLLLAGPGFAVDAATLFLALLAMGVVFSFVDMAMNVEAARIQEAAGREIMSTVHGFWSIGNMVGALMGGQIAALGLSPGLHLLAVGVVALPFVVLIAWGLPTLPPPRRADGASRPPVFALPTPALLGLCVFGTAAVLVEALARNWGGVFLRDVLAASPVAIGNAVAGFSLAMAAGRFLGNPAINRYGAVVVARVAGGVASAGLVLIIVAPDILVATAGFVALGLGGSVGFPLAVSAAARRTDRPPATNVAALALTANAFGMIAITAVGFVADASDLRIGLAITLPVLIASALLAGELRPKVGGVRPAGVVP
jgi:MFS family permease